MKISNLFTGNKPTISFEFFPPKTDEGLTNLMRSLEQLRELSPSFISMTYGAGGSTREKTVSLVSSIKKQIGLEAAAHLTCVGQTSEQLKSVLVELEKVGIENIIALRGDPPKDQTTFKPVEGGFAHASDLVKFIRSTFGFCLGVAGYPEKHVEAESLEVDLQHLTTKIRAGGDFIITQLFFDNELFFAYEKKVRSLGITSPIVAGIMPITDVDQIQRFAKLCGAQIPKSLSQKLESVRADKDKVTAVGVEYATEQCKELLKRGVAGLHFYTLNKSHSTKDIFLKLKEKGFVR